MKSFLSAFLLGIAILAIPSESFGCYGGYCGGGGYVVVAGGGHAGPPPPMAAPVPAPYPYPAPYAGGGQVNVGWGNPYGGGQVNVGWGGGGYGGFRYASVNVNVVRRGVRPRCCRVMAVRARCFGGRRGC